MLTDFLVLRLFCFNICQHKSYILNYMWTAANFIIEGHGRRLCTVGLGVSFWG